jgi:ketosteroid isomerase-like protein
VSAGAYTTGHSTTVQIATIAVTLNTVLEGFVALKYEESSNRGMIPMPRIEHPNARVVRRLYDAFARCDMETTKTCFAYNAVWHLPGRSLIAGDHRGVDAIFRFFGKLRELSGGTFKAELVDVLANDRNAVALQYATATRGTKRLDVTACQVMLIQTAGFLRCGVTTPTSTLCSYPTSGSYRPNRRLADLCGHLVSAQETT